MVSSYFLSREANIPLLPSRYGFIERTNFKLRLYALKKISPYDTERQTYYKFELHSFTRSYRIKKDFKGGWNSSRNNNRSAPLGDSETDNPRCGLDSINHHRSFDNLLAINPLKITTMASNGMNGTKAFQDTIAQYLMKRAENDPLVAVKLANPSKTME